MKKITLATDSSLLEFDKATFLERFGASIVDTIVITVLYALVVFLNVKEDIMDYRGELRFLAWPLYITYHVVFERFFRGTVGKQIFNIKVIQLNGEPVSFYMALSRNIGKLLIHLTFGQGFFKLLIPTEFQAIQDKFANAFVVRQV